MEMLLHSTKRDFPAPCVVLTLLPLYYQIDTFNHGFHAHKHIRLQDEDPRLLVEGKRYMSIVPFMRVSGPPQSFDPNPDFVRWPTKTTSSRRL